jgi:formylglycine-generating enzyme required for sulfatase activity
MNIRKISTDYKRTTNALIAGGISVVIDEYSDVEESNRVGKFPEYIKDALSEMMKNDDTGHTFPINKKHVSIPSGGLINNKYKGMEFVFIPAGKFTMGSPIGQSDYMDEVPPREVKIEKPFYMCKYPITQKHWIDIMGKNHSSFMGDGNKPVENVSWNDVQEFITKLNEKEQPDKHRLPSEAEWEYACRAGTTGMYSFGDDESNLDEYAWYKENSGGETHPVGQKKPNAWGLYDMHGNIWECVQDRWHDNYKGAPSDGSAWEDGGDSTRRAMRGGSWHSDASSCRSTNRHGFEENSSKKRLGFRLVKEWTGS